MPPASPAVELILARLRESGDFPAMASNDLGAPDLAPLIKR